jgi:hypothetical protein
MVDMYFRYIQSGVGALSKKQSVRFVIPATASSMICGGIGCGIWMLVGCVSIWSLSIVGCCAVKQEMMPWLADSGRFTKRFERVIGIDEISIRKRHTYAGMVDRHWDGIVSYCRPENKVSLGFMEGPQYQNP